MTRRLLIVALVTALAAGRAGSQQARRAVVTHIGAPIVVVTDSTPRGPHDSTASDAGGEEREVASVVVAAAAPRSFRVVTVTVPAELRATRKIAYDVVADGSISLLGARHGTIAGSSAVMLTVGVPATAAAGRTRAGFVRFVADGRPAVRAPIDVEVNRIARVTVTATQTMRGAHPGDRVELAFTILNAGNQLDTLALSLEAPARWNARIVGAPRFALQRGESIERSVAATIPLSADLGDGAITLVATTQSRERAFASSIVEVSDPAHGARRPGPVVTVGAASAMSTGMPTRAVESVAIDGPLTDAVSISGRLSTPVANDLIDGRALAMLGYNSQANFFSLAAPTWGTTIGTTGFALGDLGGQNLFGRGASLRLGPADERLQLLAAAPLEGQDVWSTPTLFSATTQKQFGVGMVSAFFSHLRDSTYLVRNLDAVGASLETQPWTNADVTGTVAERTYRDGSGLGAEADLRGPLAGGDLLLKITHAPGGTAAFAPARDALSFGAARSLGRLLTNFSYWSMKDDNAAQSAIGSAGWSLSPTYAILPTFTLGADVMHSSVTSRDSLSGFGSTQTDYALRARLLAAGFDIAATTRLSNLTQSVADSAISVQDGASRRVINQLSIDRVGARGSIGVSGSIQAASFGLTAAPPQSTLDAHIDRFQFWPRFPRWTVSASTQQLRYGSVSVMTSQAELNVDVQRSLRIVLGAERGSARDDLGFLHTVITLKVERSSSIGALDRRVVTGMVFQDRNGNGVRDPGEPGVPGIVVHRGAETAVTDANGEYRMISGSTVRAEIDDRTLPKGWIQSPRSLDGAGDPLELGVIPMAALDVRVDLAPLADGTVPAVRVGTVTLTLRDSAGREWIARADVALRATFDGLPAGRYTLTTDLEGSSEPLSIDQTPVIEIGGTPGRQRVVVTLRTRPVKIFRTKQQVEKSDRGAS